MIFSLEALQAFHGDSLLVHAGTAAEPVAAAHRRRAVGHVGDEPAAAPGGAARRAGRRRRAADRPRDGQPHRLRPRRRDGRLRRASSSPSSRTPQPLRYAVETLWHNSFDDVLGNDAEELRAAAVEVLAAPLDDRVADEIRAAGLAVVASVAEGRELRDQAGTLGWSINEPFDGPVVLPQRGRAHDHARPAEAHRRLPARRAAREAARRVGQVAEAAPQGGRQARRRRGRAATTRPTTCRASSCSPSATASGCC